MAYDKSGNLKTASPFSNAPLDASRRTLSYAKSVATEDAAGTTSPVTGTTAVTLEIPPNAVSCVLLHDSTDQDSTVSFNGGNGSVALGASQVLQFDCAGQDFDIITVTPGAATTNVYFLFEEI